MKLWDERMRLPGQVVAWDSRYINNIEPRAIPIQQEDTKKYHGNEQLTRARGS